MKRKRKENKEEEEEVEEINPKKRRKKQPTPYQEVVDEMPVWNDGKIVRLELHNFMTYEDVVLEPGPGLNLVIGANGTGKSSIVNAFCIGLAGNARVLGRASTLKQYIRHSSTGGCWLEIELYRSGRDNLVIRRSIRNNTSTWKINGEQSTAGEVEEEMKRLNIQFDNLTQFLPQDKVSEFASLTPERLLECTQQALLKPEEIQCFEELKDMQNNNSDGLDKIYKRETDLVQKKKEIMTYQKEAENFFLKQDIQKKLQVMRMKLEFTRFDELRIEANKTKAQYLEATKDYHKFSQNESPLQKKINEFQSKKGANKKAMEDMRVKQRKVDRKQENDSKVLAKEKNNFKEIKSKIKRIAKTEMENEQRKHSLRSEIEILEEKQKKFPDMAAQKQEMGELEKKRKRLEEENKARYKKIDEYGDKLERIEAKKRRKSRELRKIQDLEHQREQMVRARFNNEFYIYRWIKKNRGYFDQDVLFVPMCVDVLKPEHVTKLEFHVKRNIWGAFVCQNNQDRRRLLDVIGGRDKRVKERFHKGANVILLSDRESIQQPYPIENLKKYGIDLYLSDVYTGHPLIKQLLDIETNGVVIAKNDKHFGKMFNETAIRMAFDNRSRHRHIVSAYGNRARSTQILQIRHDTAQLLMVSRKGEEEQLKNELIVLEKKVKELRQEQNEVSKLSDDCSNEIATCNKRKAKIRKIFNKIKQANRSLERKKLELADISKLSYEDEKKKLLQRRRANNRKRTKLYTIYANRFKYIEDCLDEYVQYNVLGRQIEEELQKLLDTQKNERDKKSELKKRMDSLKEIYTKAKRELIIMKRKCLTTKMDYMNQYDLTDEQVKMKMAELSDDLEELQRRINEEDDRYHQIIADQNSVDEFERRKKEIEELEEVLKKLKDDRNTLDKRMKEKERKWAGPLREKMKKINETFLQFCKNMGIVGEIQLKIIKEKYEDSRIDIAVKFRDKEKLHRLSSTRHSGGEKSVTTILYLLSMQKQTNCPFFVVDEINQGMDGVNERKVFMQMLKSAKGKDVPQSFLITPKLLPNLVPATASNISVFFIFNGAHSLDSDDQKRFGRFVLKY